MKTQVKITITLAVAIVLFFLNNFAIAQQVFTTDVVLQESSPLLAFRNTGSSWAMSRILFSEPSSTGAQQNMWSLRYGPTGTNRGLTICKYVNGSETSILAFDWASARANMYGTMVVRDGIGIGTSSIGTYMLAVNGSIRAKEIKVDTGWADFVFADDYQLPSLQDVEAFIKANKHLPEIPSEAEVTENGIFLGEMNAKLLQKIEELTLYAIAQEKKLEQKDLEVEALQKRLERLEQLLIKE